MRDRPFPERQTTLSLLPLFFLTCFASLALSAAFPLYVLAAGPLFFGLPHILAGLNYIPKEVTPSQGQRRFLLTASFLWGAVVLVRLTTDLDGKQVGLVAMAATFLMGRWSVRGAAGLAALIAVALAAPLWFAGALTLAHNAVAFVYWILAARGRENRRAAWIALAAFVVVNAAIFSGMLDSWTLLADWPASGIDGPALGSSIVPWSVDPALFARCLVAFAFGQTMHYFVWLKAIPDLHAASTPQTGFLRLAGGAFALSCLAAGAVWALKLLPEARSLYFSIAAYHGFFELAGLGLLPRKNG